MIYQELADILLKLMQLVESLEGSPCADSDLKHLRDAATILLFRACVRHIEGFELQGLSLFQSCPNTGFSATTCRFLSVAQDLDPLTTVPLIPIRDFGSSYEQILTLTPQRKDGVLCFQGVKGDDRSSQGAHYTPPEIVEEIVRPALGHLFQQHWAASNGDLQVYRESILNLKVCDPAMGSAYFLTSAALEIARELAWLDLNSTHRPFEWHEPLLHINPIGPNPDNFSPDRRSDDSIYALPQQPCYGGLGTSAEFESAVRKHLPVVIEKCIYGVDINPMATEIAKLYVGAFVRDQGGSAPSHFNLECGNSLLGLTFNEALHEIQTRLGLCISEPMESSLFAQDAPPSFVGRYEGGHDPEIRWVYDLAMTCVFYDLRSIEQLATHCGISPTDITAFHVDLKDLSEQESGVVGTSLQVLFETMGTKLPFPLGFQKPLHWELTFPDVFTSRTCKGFDLIVANPPFVGDKKIRNFVGSQTLGVLRHRYMEGAVGDLCAFFMRLFGRITGYGSVISTVGPNTLAQTSNRRYALVPLVAEHPHLFHITRARQSDPWPGEASVFICTILMVRRLMLEQVYFRIKRHTFFDKLTNAPISSYLDFGPETDFRQLSSMKSGLIYQGMILRGPYFLPPLENETLKQTIERVPEEERSALCAYFNNKDLQQQAIPIPTRVSIDFHNDFMSLGLEQVSSKDQLEWLEKNRPMLLESLSQVYPGEETSVKKMRTDLKSNNDNNSDKEYWWMFGRPRPELKIRWKELDHVVVFGAVSKVWSPAYISKLENTTGLPICPSHRLFISPVQEKSFFGVLASFLFEVHMRREASTLETRLNVTPTESLTVFPMPWKSVWDASEKQPVMSVPPAAMEQVIGQVVDRLLVQRQSILENPDQHGITAWMRNNQWGPTDLYNLYDDPEITLPAIETLREIHRELLNVVLESYGWDDMIPNITWHFDQPWIDRTTRYVPDAQTRSLMFERLSQLNLERWLYELDLYREPVLAKMLPHKSYTLTALLKALDNIKIQPSDLEALLSRIESVEQIGLKWAYKPN